jgi:sugar phosphate isomerase/epimerase
MHRPTRRELFAAASAAVLARRLEALPLAEIKLGVTTDEIADDVLTAARFLRDHKLRWAEVRNIWGKYNTVLPIEKAREAMQILDSHGVKVSVEGTGFFKIPLPPDGAEGQKILDAQWALLDASLERARVFGTNTLRIFSFMLGRDEQPSAESYARIAGLLGEASRRARGFRLAIENIGGGHVWSGAQCGEFLKRVKEDNIGLAWDPNNAAQSGEQPFPDGYRKIDAARIFHVHLRDFRRENGRVVWAAVGAGEMDNLGQIRALLKDGYKGSFTLETHWKDPKGPLYSTETSLAGLLKVIEKV